MTHPLLTRAHLEAVLVATAIVRPEAVGVILARVDRDRITVPAWTLLAELAEPTHEYGRDWPVHATTIGQRKLADRADAVTVSELCFWPLDVLLDLVNQLPDRSEPAAWERDLARADVARDDHDQHQQHDHGREHVA